MNLSLRTKLEIAVSLIFCAIILYYGKPKYEPVGITTVAMTAPELKDEARQDIKPPKVSVFAPAAKKKLELPPVVQNDDGKFVLASSKLPDDTHSHTVTTVIDEKTGESVTYDRRDPYPWLAPNQTGSLWIRYGIKNGGNTVWMATVSEDVFQIKALHFGVAASLATDGSIFAGIGGGLKW